MNARWHTHASNARSANGSSCALPRTTALAGRREVDPDRARPEQGQQVIVGAPEIEDARTRRHARCEPLVAAGPRRAPRRSRAAGPHETGAGRLHVPSRLRDQLGTELRDRATHSRGDRDLAP